MNIKEAHALVEKLGIVTESAHTHIPNIAEMVTDSGIEGSWWNHPESHEIFKITRSLRASPDILTCRFIEGKITFIHRRVWSLLVKLKD